MNDHRDLPPLPPSTQASRRHSTRSKDRSLAIANLLNEERKDHLDTQRELERIKEQLRVQMILTQEAENKVVEATNRLRRVNEERLAAVRETSRLNESLQLYRFQLETAQNEINRAQSVFNIVEKERYKAEVAGAKSRTVARKLHEQQKIYNAREEGRRQGLQEGLEAGRLHVLTSEADGLDTDLFGDDGFYGDEIDARASEFDDPFDATSMRSRISRVADGHRLSRISATPDPVPIPPPVVQQQPAVSSQTPDPLPIPVQQQPPPVAVPQPEPAPAAPLSPLHVFTPFHDIHPTPVHNHAPHALGRHSEIPPDGYIPTVGPEPGSVPEVPPPHEFLRHSVVVEEPAVSPSAFARALSPRGSNRPISVAGESTTRRAPSAAGGSVRSMKMPTPRTQLANPLHDIELEAARRESLNLGSTSSGYGGSINIGLVPASPESRTASQRFVGSPSAGTKLFGNNPNPTVFVAAPDYGAPTQAH
uniref:Uncharacterized protein n=1 Tax=Mycena chlorophos TaxID=658473 RepID=A0ABQ0M388_MYCCL|nr:predicted protein [Mycena chlorophos]